MAVSFDKFSQLLPSLLALQSGGGLDAGSRIDGAASDERRELMFKAISRMLLSVTWILCWAPRPAATIARADTVGGVQTKSHASAERWLAADGTLDLSAAYSGSVDFTGYDVMLDPVRGPVFSPQADGLAAASGQWAGVGAGDGALNRQIYSIAVIGSDVFVGGPFANAANLPAADGIVRWDGQQWFALGGDSNGDGALNGSVDAMAVHGSTLYIGGTFTRIKDGPTTINAAGYVARWDGSHWSALGSNGADGPALNLSVRTLAVDAQGVLYAGGGFTNVNNHGVVLPEADYVARWDGLNWSSLGHNGAGNGALNASVTTLQVDAGGLYVGGWFTNVSDSGISLPAADYVAHWNGVHWSALGDNGAGNGSLSSVVNALAMSGSDLYVGGSFTTVNNHGVALPTAAYLARWDGADWSPVTGPGGMAAFNAPVHSITLYNGDLYVGGCFYNVVDGSTALPAADGIAQWDGLHWSGLGSNGGGNGSITMGTSCPTDQGVVQVLTAAGNRLLVGGKFFDVNNSGTVLTGADMLAAWDGVNWSEIEPGPNGSLNDYVHAIVVHGTDVFVGGAFTDVSDNGTNLMAADYIARWDGAHWSALGADSTGNGSLRSSVWALAMDELGNLYAGGSFVDVRDGATTLSAADYVARWNGAHWSALGDNGSGGGALNRMVMSLTVSGSSVFAGGGFTNVNNHGVVNAAADYVARWDGTDWSALGDNGSGDGALNNSVYALAVSGTDLYVGGQFTDASNHGVENPAADYIARWDGSTWSSLGSDGAGGGSINDDPSSDYVRAILVDGSDVYVGGSFNDINDNGTILPAADLIARWNGVGWAALGDNGSGDGVFSVGEVRAIALHGSTIYAGGTFSAVNGSVTAANAARWNGTTWAALSSNGVGQSSLSRWVSALGVLGDDLLVGGMFLDVRQSGVTVAAGDYLAAYGIGIDLTPPTITSITPLDSTPTNQTALSFGVAFSEVVTGVSAADFVLEAAGPSGAHITGVTGADLDYVVQVESGTGDGALHLIVPVTATIADYGGNPLAGLPYTSGQTYAIDRTAPAVLSIIRADPTPTAAAAVTFTVTLSEPVTGVGTGDFALSSVGVVGAFVESVSGSGTTYSVIVHTGDGIGTLRLDLHDDDTIQDLAGNALGGPGTGNGSHTAGETYTVARPGQVYLPLLSR